MNKLKQNKLKVEKGNPSTQCTWVVKQFRYFEGWEIIAEFWLREDAYIFIKAKRKELKNEKIKRNKY